MHKLYDLKEKLCDELEKYAEKDVTASSLEVIDKLAHSIKNLNKVINEMDDGYSDRMSMRRSYGRYDDMSYAPKRDMRGRYARDMASDLRELMREAPEHTKGEFRKLIEKVEMD